MALQCIGHYVILQTLEELMLRLVSILISYYYNLFTIFPTCLGLEVLYTINKG